MELAPGSITVCFGEPHEALQNSWRSAIHQNRQAFDAQVAQSAGLSAPG